MQKPWGGEALNKKTIETSVGEGNGTPLQENPMDGGAW